MSISFPQTEEDVLRLWKDIDAFQTQMRLTEGRDRFTFYDGPPFGQYILLSQDFWAVVANVFFLQIATGMAFSKSITECTMALTYH